jgi:hypothetical protein
VARLRIDDTIAYQEVEVRRSIRALVFCIAVAVFLGTVIHLAFANFLPPVEIKSPRGYVIELIPLFIEALYFKWFLKLGYVRSLLLSAVANLVSFLPSMGAVHLGVNLPAAWFWPGDFIGLCLLFVVTVFVETPVYYLGMRAYGLKFRWRVCWLANLMSYPVFLAVAVILGYYTLTRW